ncbi:MAG TPA: ABC transporter permease [Lactobacillus sp.]|nr:ABC transporter permease [Lactobacillus sp.]
MYLGLKEMRYEKLRFSLLTGVMILIALVVFVLAGLADGLSQGNRQAIDQWQAKYVYLNKDANKNISASQLTTDAKKDVKGTDVAAVSTDSTVLRKRGNNTKIDVSAIGTESKAFTMPKIIHGHAITGSNQIIISQNLRDQGIKVGDQIRLGSNTTLLKVVGSYQASTYSIAPTLYTSLGTIANLKAAGMPVTKPLSINAIVTKTSHLTGTKHNLQRLPINDFIQNLPGYSAEQTTLNTMIYFLFAMSLAIIGIFMYVLTLQKSSLFGVLKVEGIGTRHILASVVTQAAVMSVISVAIGLLVTIGIGSIAPSGMPFALNYPQLGIYAISLILASILGSLLSWRTIAKINPVTAIK